MAKVIVTKSKLDALNSAISAKSGAAAQRTLDGMTAALAAIPPDTGAGGAFKAALEGNVTSIVSDSLTALRAFSQCENTALGKVSLPNALSVGSSAFKGCTKLTGVIDLSSATLSSNSDNMFFGALRRTCKVLMRSIGPYAFYSAGCNHLWLPQLSSLGRQYAFLNSSALRTLQFDSLTSVYLSQQFGTYANFNTLIIRTPQVCASAISSSSGNFVAGGTGRIYVPASLLPSYGSLTNWAPLYNAGIMVGIDEDTVCAKGAVFTPNAAAAVDHWDQVDLQSYSVGAVDTASGSITPSCDGRLLIRGLDAAGAIVHVTYLQIGSGIDEEANIL